MNSLLVRCCAFEAVGLGIDRCLCIKQHSVMAWCTCDMTRLLSETECGAWRPEKRQRSFIKWPLFLGFEGSEQPMALRGESRVMEQ